MNAEIDITNVRLETDRMIIRPWKADDLKDFYEYASVDGVGQMAGWNPHTSIQDSQRVLNLFIEGKVVFALELKENHKVIGSLGLEEISTSIDENYDRLLGRELGYVLSKAYWGKGLMPEAVKRVIQYSFEEKKLDYLVCSHFATNTQSKRVIEKSGFRFVKEKMIHAHTGEDHVTYCYVLDNM